MLTWVTSHLPHLIGFGVFMAIFSLAFLRKKTEVTVWEWMALASATFWVIGVLFLFLTLYH